jgi:acid phosphatase
MLQYVMVAALMIAGGSITPAAAQDAPRAATPRLSFLVLGDWGMGNEGQRAVAAQMGRTGAEVKAAFVVTAGDNFYPAGVASTTDPYWKERFESVYSAPALQVPWYPVLGNHDYNGSVQAEIDYSNKSARWRLPARYYTVRKAIDDTTNVELFMIDTQEFEKPQGKGALAELAWLDSALAASTAKWKLVVGHHPILTATRPYRTPSLEMYRDLLPVIEKRGAQAYISGHDHDLQHLNSKRRPTHFFVAGAGAAPRKSGWIEDTLLSYSDSPGFMVVELYAAEMRVRFVSDSGKEVYATVVPSAPPVAVPAVGGSGQ